MSILDLLRRSPKRFLSERRHRSVLASQTALTPRTVGQLRGLGVGPEKELALEYFFYTDAKAKAGALQAALAELGYSAEARESAHDGALFLITGWTTKMVMAEPVVVEWTARMCMLGFGLDCEFDGWGTNPEQ